MSHIGEVQFIDYEYSGYNYLAYDIGNHFNEFAGETHTSLSGFQGSFKDEYLGGSGTPTLPTGLVYVERRPFPLFVIGKYSPGGR